MPETNAQITRPRANVAMKPETKSVTSKADRAALTGIGILLVGAGRSSDCLKALVRASMLRATAADGAARKESQALASEATTPASGSHVEVISLKCVKVTGGVAPAQSHRMRITIGAASVQAYNNTP